MTMRFLLAALHWLLAWPVQAQDPLAPFIPPPDPTTPGTYIEGHLLGGRADAWPGAPDLLFRNTVTLPPCTHFLCDGSPKLYARSLLLGEIGDGPDLALRRAGPDGAPYNTTEPAAVPSGTSLGPIYWMAYGGKYGGGLAWNPAEGGGPSSVGRNAQIYAKAVNAQTATNRAGEFFIGTTPPGNPGNPIDRFRITAAGRTCIFFIDTPDGTPGWYEIRQGKPDTFANGWRTLVTRNNPDCTP